MKLYTKKTKSNIHKSQYIDQYTGELTPKSWESCMTPKEVKWCYRQIDNEVLYQEHDCVDSYRAARAWKGSQIHRFKRYRSCCGCHEWSAFRWSWKKCRFDKYILGYNWGH